MAKDDIAQQETLAAIPAGTPVLYAILALALEMIPVFLFLLRELHFAQWPRQFYVRLMDTLIMPFWLLIVFALSLVAIVLGHVKLSSRGKDLALAGLIIGYIDLGLFFMGTGLIILRRHV